MTRRSRRNHAPAFKSEVALAALKGKETLAQLAERFDVHRQSDRTVEAAVLPGAAEVFSSGSVAVLLLGPSREQCYVVRCCSALIRS
jgi:hypothetical protein